MQRTHDHSGERWNQQKYDEMNERFQRQALEHLRDLAKQDKPFFLQYWPVIPLSKVAQAIAEALTALDGVSLAVATGSLTDQNDHPLLAQIRNNHHVSRSGDIYIVQEPYWFLFDKGPVKVMHGSPWRYDTHVPIVFAGPGVDARRVDRLVHPVDVAPTIAAVLGMSPPGASRGTGLDEVLQRSAAATPSAVHSSSRR